MPSSFQSWSLPSSLTSFIGREADVAALRALIVRPDTRLVTLTGAGGSGKTRLALEVAHSLEAGFPHGVWFVPLASTRDAALVVPAIARAMQVNDAQDGSPLDALTSQLRSKTLLLILDNFEHVLEAGAAVAQLLASCPDVKVLVTSRATLHITGEWEFVVSPLAVPLESQSWTMEKIAGSDAVRLFVERARAAQHAFALTPSNAGEVAGVCTRLDGLPLAIELAAARVKVFSPHELLARLDHRLPLLTGGPRDVPLRLRTMRDAIAWSYDLLAPDEQRLFQRLGVFVGGFTLEAAECVAAHSPGEALAIVDGIAALVDKSLLGVTIPQPGQSPVGGLDLPRFTMLETIREFAIEKLAHDGEELEVRRAHAGYFRDLAERAEPALRGHDQTAWLTALEGELANIRSAFEWALEAGEAETGLRLAGALYWFWYLRNRFSEATDWFFRARSFDPAPTTAWANVLLGSGLFAWRAGEYVDSEAFLRRAQDLFEMLGDRWKAAMAMHHLGHIAEDLDHDLPRSLAILSESLAQFQLCDDAWGIAYTKRCLGRAWVSSGDFGQGVPLLEEALARLRQLGDQWCVGNTLHYLGDVARQERRYDDAIGYFQESVAQSWAQRDALTVADGLLRLGQILVECGEPEQAARLFGAAQTQRDYAGIQLYGPVRPGYEHSVNVARAALGGRFTIAWEAGQSLTVQQAIDEAARITIPRLRSPADSEASPSRSDVALSARERDVLRLIVAGHSDREIAELLSIGRRTVNSHVTAILNKLGVHSRTAAATWAVRHDLG